MPSSHSTWMTDRTKGSALRQTGRLWVEFQKICEVGLNSRPANLRACQRSNDAQPLQTQPPYLSSTNEILSIPTAPTSAKLAPNSPVSIPLWMIEDRFRRPEKAGLEKIHSAPTHDAISTNTATRIHFPRTHKCASTASEKEIRDSLQVHTPPKPMPVQQQSSIHQLLYRIGSVKASLCLLPAAPRAPEHTQPQMSSHKPPLQFSVQSDDTQAHRSRSKRLFCPFRSFRTLQFVVPALRGQRVPGRPYACESNWTPAPRKKPGKALSPNGRGGPFPGRRQTAATPLDDRSGE